MARWQQKPKPTAKQQQTIKRAAQLGKCEQGNHLLTPTFRAGEQVCTSCGIVFYCPDCLALHHLPASQARRAYPLSCSMHLKAEVQA